MLKVRNNDITLSRGETGMITYIGVKQNGEPFILPVADDLGKPLKDRATYAILAFTVRTAIYGDVVIEKYFDLEDAPMYDGDTDFAEGGYHKFTSQVIEETTESSVVRDNPGRVYKLLADGAFTYSTGIQLAVGDPKVKVVEYSFKVSLPIEFNDTALLEPKEYVYDLTLYFGYLRDEEIKSLQGESYRFVSGFPLKTVTAKFPLITPHKFIVGDSNNV